MTILYIYITCFTLYFVLLAFSATKKVKKVHDKYTSKDANLCVVVYASGNETTLDNLIKQLKNQNYSKRHYKIYAVLDKFENTSDITLTSDLDIDVININNLEPIGKSQAYSILAEKLFEAENLDAFVFLDAKNYVEEDFLYNINYYLTKYDVFIPSVNYISDERDLTFFENVKALYSRYYYKFILTARTRLGLTNLINTDSFVIKKKLLNKLASFNFKNKTEEAEYTLKLANENANVALAEDLRVFTSINNFDTRIPSLSGRLELFREYFSKPMNFTAKEYLFSFLNPNWLTVMLIFGALLFHSYKSPFFWVSFTTVLLTAIVFCFAYSLSLLSIRIYAKEYIYLFAYPLHSIARITLNLPPIRFIRGLIQKSRQHKNIEKMITDVIVSDGKNDYKCQLELISDDGLARVKFINHGKVYTTKNNHLRMVDAIRELTSKLNDYGLTLKVCLCCKSFQPIVDGSTNMIKGACRCKFEGRVDGDIIPTFVWNTCPKFQENNVVSLF